MRSANIDILPPRLKRMLAKLGADIRLARRKRSVTVASMAERVGVSKSTYLRVERGDAKVALGVYAMALFVLGLADRLEQLADPGLDDQGLVADAAWLPKRIRAPRKANPL